MQDPEHPCRENIDQRKIEAAGNTSTGTCGMEERQVRHEARSVPKEPVDDAAGREHRGDQAPDGGGQPVAVDDPGEDGAEEDRGQDEPLRQSQHAVDEEVRTETGRDILERIAITGLTERRLDDEFAPRGQGGDKADRDGEGVGLGHFLERLRRDDEADPEQDAERDLDRHKPSQERDRANETDHGYGHGVHDRIADSRPERLPARVTDVDRGRERIAEENTDHRADAVGQQGGAGVELIAGRLRALEVLDRADDVEHGQLRIR